MKARRPLSLRFVLITFCLCGTLPIVQGFAYAQASQTVKPAPTPSPSVSALLKQAKAFFDKSEWSDAITVLGKARTESQRLKDRVGEAEVLKFLGVNYLYSRQTDRAIAVFEQALPILRETGNKNGEASTLGNMGAVYVGSGQPKKALEYFERVVLIFRETGNKNGEGKTLYNIGAVYYDLGQSRKALEYMERGANLYHETNDTWGEASALGSIGSVYTQLNEPAKALPILERALPLQQKINDTKGTAKTLSLLAGAYQKLGQPQKALEYLEKILPSQQAGDNEDLAYTLTEIGNAYTALGELEKSFDYYGQAMTLFQKFGDKKGQSRIYTQTGTLYRRLGQYQKSLEYYEKALALDRETENLSGEIVVLESIGSTYQAINQPQKALEYFKKVIALHGGTKETPEWGGTFSNIGLAYSDLNQPEKAFTYYEKALRLHRQGGNRVFIANTLGNIGLLHMNQKQPEKALPLFQEAITLRQDMGDRQGEGELWTCVAACQEIKGQDDLAETAYLTALKLQESQQSNLSQLSVETRTTYRATSYSLPNRYVQLLHRHHRDAEAFNFLQKAKAQTLVEQMNGRHIRLTGRMTEAEQKEEQAHNTACDTLTNSLLVAKNKAEVTRIKEELAKAERDRSAFLDLLYGRYPDLAPRRAVKTATLEDIAPTLPDDTALLEYLTIKREGAQAVDETLLFVVTNNKDGAKVTVHTLPITQAELMKKKTDLREACADKTLPPYQSKAKDLYQILLAPAEAELAGKARLVICPDGLLWDVPFAVLMDKDGKHLVQKNELAIAYSATAMKAALDARSAQKPTAQTLLALANPDFGDERRFDVRPITIPDRPITIPDRPITIPDRDLLLANSPAFRNGKLVPIPGTQREAESIAKDFGTRATILTGKEAQESKLKAKIGQYRYLHLATHGFFNDVAPFQSFVALAEPPKGDSENGLLTAREVFELDLSSCELTVLSACESGRGIKTVGEGIMGMTWAICAAGCPTQIVSSWKVADDATATLMSRFYAGIAKGAPKGKAFREASLSLLSSSNYNHPYYWSPFNLIGDWH